MNPESIAEHLDEIIAGGEGGAADDSGKDTGVSPAGGKSDSAAAGDKSDGVGEGGSEGGSEGDSGGDPGDKKDTAKDDKSGKSGGPKEPGGYLADEEDNDEDDGKPGEETKGQPGNLSSDLQYVVDNLPVLSVRGKTSPDGAVKTFQVKAAGQLPEEFEFASKREELLFTQALAGQELKAQQLQSQFYSNQQTKSAQEFSEKENKDIRRDIGVLQREGKLERFKLQPDDPKFNDDPGVVKAQGVIDYMNKVNAEYLELANKGGVLYHLSFRDAYRLMEQEVPPKAESKQDKEDKERKTVTRKGAGAASSTPTGGQKVPGYAYAGDLKDMVDMMDLS